MAYEIKDFDTLLQEILDDFRNQIDGANTTNLSDIYVKATALASLASGLYKYASRIEKQIFPDSADEAELKRHCGVRGITQKQATGSEGEVKLTGTPETVFSSGIEMVYAGLTFQTTEGGTIDGEGEAVVDAESVDTGADTNIQDDTELTLTSPPPGIDGTATVEGDFTGGTDQESKEELLARFLRYLRQPPAGGNADDYEKWALEVDGVDKAFCHPTRRGLGTVDVSLLAEGNTAPSSAVIDAVQDDIDELRPVAAKDFLALAPDFIEQDATVAITAEEGYEFSDIGGNKTVGIGSTQTNIVVDDTTGIASGEYVVIREEQRVVDQIIDATHFTVTVAFSFSPDSGDIVRAGGVLWQPVYDAIVVFYLDLEPGGTLYLSQLEKAISNVVGVKDRDITDPTGNVIATIDADTVELITKGDVVITA